MLYRLRYIFVSSISWKKWINLCDKLKCGSRIIKYCIQTGNLVAFCCLSGTEVILALVRRYQHCFLLLGVKHQVRPHFWSVYLDFSGLCSSHICHDDCAFCLFVFLHEHSIHLFPISLAVLLHRTQKASLCVELNLSMRPEKFPLLLINPDRHDIPLPERGEKFSEEHDGESNSHLFWQHSWHLRHFLRHWKTKGMCVPHRCICLAEYLLTSTVQRVRPLLLSASECAVKPCEDPALAVRSFYQHMSLIKPWTLQCHIEHCIIVPSIPHVVSPAGCCSAASDSILTALPTLQMGVCARLQSPVA